jgi:hypothetical protein
LIPTSLVTIGSTTGSVALLIASLDMTSVQDLNQHFEGVRSEFKGKFQDRTYIVLRMSSKMFAGTIALSITLFALVNVIQPGHISHRWVSVLRFLYACCLCGRVILRLRFEIPAWILTRNLKFMKRQGYLK